MPDDVLARILLDPALPPAGCGAVRRVCRGWRGATAAALEALRPRDWPRCPGDPARLFPTLRDLRLDRLYFDPIGRGQLALILEHLAHLPALTKLTLSKECLLVCQSLRSRAGSVQATYVVALPPAISRLTRLRSLAIVGSTGGGSGGNARTIVRLLPELAALRLESFTAHDALEPLQHLEALSGLARLTLVGDTCCDGALQQLSLLTGLQALCLRWRPNLPVPYPPALTAHLAQHQAQAQGQHSHQPRLLSLAISLPLLRALTSIEVSHVDLSAGDQHGVTAVLPRLLHPNARHVALNHNCLVGGLPGEVASMRQLASLDVSANRLEWLPAELLAVQGTLTRLVLRQNALRELPPWLGQLTALRHLDASCLPQLNSMPPSTDALSQLTMLDVSNTAVRAVPSRLVKLQQLSMSGCGLSDVPPSVGALVSLRQLDFAHNRLHCVSGGLLTPLAHTLLVLDLSSNQLTGVPGCVADLTSLRELYLHQQRLPPDAAACVVGAAAAAAGVLTGAQEPAGGWSVVLYSNLEDLPAQLCDEAAMPHLSVLGIDTDPHIRSPVLEACRLSRRVHVVQARPQQQSAEDTTTY